MLIFLFQNTETTSDAERYLIMYMIGILVLVTALVVIFFIVFQKRKNKLLLDKFKQQKIFEEELSKTQLEIQEQTLKNIGQELHDNIGQILSVASMQMSILNTQVPEPIKESFTETKNVIKDGLSELRALSKTLNSDVIMNRGFQQSVASEIERLNKLNLIEANLTVEGNHSKFQDNKDSIILFRILQEFISNTIKYSNASKLDIKLNYNDDNLNIVANDDGVGFDMSTAEKGSGLINMNNRAELIQANFDLQSSPNQGVTLILDYPYRKISNTIL